MVQKHVKPTKNNVPFYLVLFASVLDLMKFHTFGSESFKIASRTSLPIDVTGVPRSSSRTEHIMLANAQPHNKLLLHSSFSMESSHPLFLSSSFSIIQHQLAQVVNKTSRHAASPHLHQQRERPKM